MTPSELARLYRQYIGCLNNQDWDNLGKFVHEDAAHNGRALGIAGYRAMLENDYAQIPDLRFNIYTLTCEAPMVASRLMFDCTPKGEFLGLSVNGRKIRFAENVFYEYRDGKIINVLSVLDKVAIEAQLSRTKNVI
ncbi:ester cyclase [Thalassospira profundimaris]|uniref:Ester cyclase n=1 Tax=Thalassospira profundimaris TaxID=502049 RepID=A0A367XD40_9PROT|nr:ester cyclase [Thalassospira profundimaris]RCK50691.1 ester cyclase [Thalassospira profundimaris]